jgi:hypothetical protein
MSLFDLVKDSELAERIVEVEAPSDADAPVAVPGSTLPVEIQRLRQRAQVTDSRAPAAASNKPQSSDALVETFLRVCLEAAAAAAEAPQNDVPDFRDPVYPSIVRIVPVPLIVGDWSTVVDCRESAMEVVAALSHRGFASPSYRFTWDDPDWTLFIQFGY